MIDFLEICRRDSAGPLVQESKFDRELFFPKVMDLVKKHEIRHDLENPVNQDNGLADAIYEAAVDLIADVGVYCTGTQRVIEFSRDEVLGGDSERTRRLLVWRRARQKALQASKA